MLLADSCDLLDGCFNCCSGRSFLFKLNNLAMRVIGLLMAVPVVWFCIKAARENQKLRAASYNTVQSSRQCVLQH